jgi:hypothetical protein
VKEEELRSHMLDISPGAGVQNETCEERVAVTTVTATRVDEAFYHFG